VTDAQLYLVIGVPLVFNGLGFILTNKRLDDMKDLWRAELRRVEEVLDARLTHIEEKLGIGR
jgi:hypothetical protein